MACLYTPQFWSQVIFGKVDCLGYLSPRDKDFFFFFFLRPYQWHIEVPRVGVQSELQPPACVTATATPDLSFDLHHSSWQRQILNPLGEARDKARNLMVPSRIRFHCITTDTPDFIKFLKFQYDKV